MKKRSDEQRRKDKEQFYADIAAGRLTIGQATRQMRKIAGMTQTEYARQVLNIYPRVLMEIEKDKGNPRLDTLVRIARPFGLKIAFMPERLPD